jgi:hypothetical protein
VAGSCGYGEELSGFINAGNFLTSCKVYWLASQERLCFMEYVSNILHISAKNYFSENGYQIKFISVQTSADTKQHPSLQTIT